MARIHLIAIGGSIMHNLALALHSTGHEVSGSDDQIFEPARSRLAAQNLLPAQEGWNPDLINRGLDSVLLGMHAKKDNPELLKALEIKLPIFSFPEFVAARYANKDQIVVCGSHGKTTTSSMIMHILRSLDMDFDYLVGAQIEGFERMVQLTDAPLAVIEGDEYLSSCLDMRPKFVHYDPKFMILTGIAWDHFNVFPRYEDYLNAFAERIESLSPESQLIYCQEDPDVNKLIKKINTPAKLHPYSGIPVSSDKDTVWIEEGNSKFVLNIFGDHNLQNLNAAVIVAQNLGIERNKALRAIESFKGAAKRLEWIGICEDRVFYKDFAHAPSKLRATVNALKKRYSDNKLLVIAELHTYSSLNAAFIPQYLNSCDAADRLIVYIDQKAMEIKNMPLLSEDLILKAFGHRNMKLCLTADDLAQTIQNEFTAFQTILFAGSGHFGGLKLDQYISQQDKT